MLGSIGSEIVDQTFGEGCRRRLLDTICGVAGGRRLVAGPLAPLEKRVLLDLRIDKIVQFEI